MSCPRHRRWMYRRLLPDNRGHTQEFLRGVEEFDTFAQNQVAFAENDGMYRCPCRVCENRNFLKPDEVKVHLYTKGFMRGYFYWTSHGEVEPNGGGHIGNVAPHNIGVSDVNHEYHDTFVDRMDDMMNDVIEANDHNMGEESNDYQPPFYNMLQSAQEPVFDGCTTHTELSLSLRMLSLKTDFNMPQNCFNGWTGLIKELFHPGNSRVPSNYSQTRKVVKELGNDVQYFDCCRNGCMLFYKQDANLDACKFCEQPRWRRKKLPKGKGVAIPYARMPYFPLKPRLQRLYASRSTAQHMRWHHEHVSDDGVLCHPSDGLAWKYFDERNPDFAAEPRNVRLGLCADGFDPFNNSTRSYSIWPVVVTPYNLPPELCMTTPFMFLSCLVPGPKNPKNKIDVYLQPLIDELKELWEDGVETYDISKGEYFQMKAALMWTINDFPAYGMLSGWSTHGKLACPVCMKQTEGIRLKHGGKFSWFDSHRCFLPSNHRFRGNRTAFRKGKTVRTPPPRRLEGDEIWREVEDFPLITESGGVDLPGFKENQHNWTKKSIFWELPYWKDQKLRHNLDVMHIEKNFFENILNTIMDVRGKTKDDDKARRDVADICDREELHLIPGPRGKDMKPVAKFVLPVEKRRELCDWIKEIRMPDGYCSNLRYIVDKTNVKFSNMKSHDCHVFMETLLPVAFGALPVDVLKPLIEISKFFKNLCATTLNVEALEEMHQSIPLILCKLETIFPPGFFNVMEHLPVHLAEEAILGGPVQYRWMYPFERFFGRLKKTILNQARPEGCMVEAYLNAERSYFSSYYFGEDVPSMRTRCRRNEDDERTGYHVPTLSVFEPKGKPFGRSTKRFLSDDEYVAAHLHVLLNCEEVQPYKDMFVQQVRMHHNMISDADVDQIVTAQFAEWFRKWVPHLQMYDDAKHMHLSDLALGPIRMVTSWSAYKVNGYKFHNEARSADKKTCNCGVGVCGAGEGDIESDYYGILKDVVELEYPGEPIKRCVLFSCEWYDPTLNRGTRANRVSRLIEVHRTKRYGKYDPFIFAETASQVYFMPHPSKTRENRDWLVVMAIKPRARIDKRYTLPLAHQESDMTTLGLVEDVIPASLADESGAVEEVDHVEEGEEDVEEEPISDGEYDTETDSDEEREEDENAHADEEEDVDEEYYGYDDVEDDD